MDAAGSKNLATHQNRGGADGKEGLIVAAAKAIGSVAGTVAHSIGVRDDTPPPAQRSQGQRSQGKLPPKHKARLPRRIKKNQRKQGTGRKAN